MLFTEPCSTGTGHARLSGLHPYTLAPQLSFPEHPSLQERAGPGGRTHIPYRNSMMTTVLRDSLGGNCCTAMVATISPSADQLPESIATCRFAQRVAQISNQVGLCGRVGISFGVALWGLWRQMPLHGVQ